MNKLIFLKSIQEKSNDLYQFWIRHENLINKFKPIDLHTHFINFCPNPEMNNILANVVLDKTKPFNQYTRDYGHTRLVNALSEYYTNLLKREISIGNILITMGITQALFNCISGFIEKDDEVILLTPIYDNCKPLVLMYGGKVHECPLKYIAGENKPNQTLSNWIIDLEYLKTLFNNKTKLIILSNPNFLLGKVCTKNELEFIGNLCKEWNVLCIIDECLDSTVIQNKHHIRMATLPETWDRTLIIGGGGVTYGRTGWKVAWIYGPSKLIERLNIIHQLTFSSFTPVQETLARFIEKYGLHYFQRYNYDQNRNLLFNCFKKLGFRNVISPEGGYYIVVEIDSEQIHNDLNVSEDYIAKWLISTYGIIGVPIMNNENKCTIFVCFSFAQKYETIELAVKQIQSKEKMFKLNMNKN